MGRRIKPEHYCVCMHRYEDHKNGRCVKGNCACQIYAWDGYLYNPCTCKHFLNEHIRNGVHACAVTDCCCGSYKHPYPHEENKMEPFCMCGHLSSHHQEGSFCKTSGCTCQVFTFEKGTEKCECKHFQQEHRIGGVHGCVILGCPCTEYNGEVAQVSDREPMPGTTNDWHAKETEARSDKPEPDWRRVAAFFNSIVEDPEENLKVVVESPMLGVKMTVHIPSDRVEEFMKRLPFFEAVVEKL